MNTRALLIAGCLALAAASARAADAVTPKAELFGGYSYTKSGDQSLHGWDASLGVTLTRWIGVEADVSGHYGSDLGVSTNRLFFMGGPRFVYRGGGIAVFAHYLAGGARTRSGITVAGVDIAETTTDFAMAAGGGVDLRVSGRWAVRAQGDYVFVDAPGGSEHEPRISVGAVYRFGVP